MSHQRWKMGIAVTCSVLLLLHYGYVAGERIYDLQEYGSLVCRSESVCHVSANDGEVREKRIVLTVLFATSVIMSLVNVGMDIYLQIEGCAGLYPSMKTTNSEIENIRKQLVEISEKSNDQYTASKNVLEYMKNTNRLNRDLWFHVFRIMELTEMVFEEIDPRMINNFMEKSLYLKRELQKRNKTLEQMDFKGLSAEYEGIFSSVNSAMIGLTPIVGEIGGVAMMKGLKWYKSYKITRDIQSNAAQLANLNMKGRAVLGVNNVNTYVKSTATAQTKALSTATKMSKLATGATAALSIVAIGMEVYMLVMKIKACEKQRDKLREALAIMKPQVATFTGTFNEIKAHHASLETEYQKAKSQITSDIFFQYLSNITLLAKSGHKTDSLVIAAEEVKSFESKIKNANYDKTIELQTKLIDALKKFTFTWSCYETQVKIISYVANKCEVGFGSVRTLYDQAIKHFVKVDDCTSVVGEKYTTFEKTKTYAEFQMNSKKLSTDCLLNNEVLFDLTCNLNAKGWDAEYISKKTGLNQDQVKLLVAKCPLQKLSPRDKRVICRLKKYGESLDDIKGYYSRYEVSDIVSTFNTCAVKDEHSLYDL